jgi:hypothetical protein
MHETLNAVGDAATVERVVPEPRRFRVGSRQHGWTADGDRCSWWRRDGAHASTRPAGGRRTKRGRGAWREVKGFGLYLLRADERIVQVASWHLIAGKAELSAAFKVVADRTPQDRVRIALVAGGADWSWDVFHEHSPTGEGILDAAPSERSRRSQADRYACNRARPQRGAHPRVKSLSCPADGALWPS